MENRHGRQPSANGYYYSLDPHQLRLCDAYVYDDFDEQTRFVVLTCKGWTYTNVEGGANVDVPLVQVAIDQDRQRALSVEPGKSGKGAFTYLAAKTLQTPDFLEAIELFQELLRTTAPFPRKVKG